MPFWHLPLHHTVGHDGKGPILFHFAAHASHGGRSSNWGGDASGCGIFGKSLAKNSCPDCGRNGFYVGPSGDASTNIYCANSDCKAAFNFAYVFGEGHAERIGKAPDWYKYPGEDAHE